MKTSKAIIHIQNSNQSLNLGMSQILKWSLCFPNYYQLSEEVVI